MSLSPGGILTNEIAECDGQLVEIQAKLDGVRTALGKLNHKRNNFYLILEDWLDGKGIAAIAQAIHEFRNFMTGHVERRFAPIILSQPVFGKVVGLDPPIETSVAWLLKHLSSSKPTFANEIQNLLAARKDLAIYLNSDIRSVTESQKSLESVILREKAQLENELLQIPVLESEERALLAQTSELLLRRSTLVDFERQATAKQESLEREELARAKAEAERVRILEYQKYLDNLGLAIDNQVSTFGPSVHEFVSWFNKPEGWKEHFGDLLELSRSDEQLFKYFVCFFNMFKYQGERRSNHCYRRYSSLAVKNWQAMETIEHLCFDHLKWPFGDLKKFVSKHEVYLKEKFSLGEGDIWQSLANSSLDGEEVIKEAFIEEFYSRLDDE
jgi:hypothetical protein